MLKHSLGRALGAALVVINLVLAGCAATTPAPAPTTLPTAAPAVVAPTVAPPAPAPSVAPLPAEVGVSQVRVVRNALDQAVVVGWVFNGTANDVAAVELTISAVDAAGATLIKDLWSGELVEQASFAPLVEGLAAGARVPFAYIIYQGEPAQYAVTVSGQTAGAIGAQAVGLQNAQLLVDSFGETHLLGETVNGAAAALTIESLYAVLFAADGGILAVEDADSMVRQLDGAGSAGASAPIDINLGAVAGQPVDYAIYARSSAAEPANVAVEFGEQFASYVDPAGVPHLVGMIGNADSAPLSMELVAGLYDADGVVLDSASGGLYYLRLPAGARVPYDFADFTLVQTMPALAERIARYTVQLDPRYSYREEQASLVIESAGDSLSTQDERWEVSGEVLNSTTTPVGRVVLVAALHDDAGNPRVVGYKILDTFAGPALAPGTRAPYSLSLPADLSLDPANLTLHTYVFADQAQ